MNQATITFASAAPVVIVGERLAELESIIYRGFQTYVKRGAALEQRLTELQWPARR